MMQSQTRCLTTRNISVFDTEISVSFKKSTVELHRDLGCIIMMII